MYLLCAAAVGKVCSDCQWDLGPDFKESVAKPLRNHGKAKVTWVTVRHLQTLFKSQGCIAPSDRWQRGSILCPSKSTAPL